MKLLKPRLGQLDFETCTVERLFDDSGWDDADAEGSLRRLARTIDGVDGLRFVRARMEAIRRLTRAGTARPREMVEVAFAPVGLKKPSGTTTIGPEPAYGFSQPLPHQRHQSATTKSGRKRFTFWISRDHALALNEIKTRDGVSLSEQIRRALEAWIQSRPVGR